MGEAQDREAGPGLPADAAVEGRPHEGIVSEELTLRPFTTVAGRGSEWAELYRRRWDVETDLRDLKRTRALDRVGGRGVAMVEAEVTLGVLAYSLVNETREVAARAAGVEPRRLSFAGVWSPLGAFLRGVRAAADSGGWAGRFERLLRAAGQRKLPVRPGRSFPRTVLPHRRKYATRKRDPGPDGDMDTHARSQM